MNRFEERANDKSAYFRLLSLLWLPFRLAHDSFWLQKLGIFQAYSYRIAYLKESSWDITAVLHYLLVGERRGYRPNAFFDPAYYRRSRPDPKSSVFMEYLNSKSSLTPSPSVNFDHQWYCEQNPDWSNGFDHPFLHFWHYGIFNGRNPTPRFDLDFFIRSVGRDHFDKKTLFYEKLAHGSNRTPLNEQELRRLQDNFYKGIVLRVVREVTEPKHPFLVFVQTSENYRSELLDETREYDVLLNYYDNAKSWSPAADYVLVQMGTKTTAIRKILEERPEFFERYNAILFLDDDVEIDRVGVMRLFQTMKNLNLDLVQASLTRESDCYFDVIKHPPIGSTLCALKSVEIMMPVVSRRALMDLGWVFKEGISGWAVDFLLSAQVRHRYGNKIALVADVVAKHVRRTDVSSGAFYCFLRKHGIDPNTEAGYIAWKYGVDDSALAISIHEQPLDCS